MFASRGSHICTKLLRKPGAMSYGRIIRGYPYPASSREASPSAEEEQLEYALACVKWARKLPEGVLREFASEYMRGNLLPENEDAFIEYKRRESLGKLSHQRSQESTLSTQKSRSRNRSKRA